MRASPSPIRALLIVMAISFPLIAAGNPPLSESNAMPRNAESALRGMPGSLFILTNQTAQDELHLSLHQRGEIARLSREYAKAVAGGYRTVSQSSRVLPSETRDPNNIAEVVKRLNEQTEEYEKQARSLLDSGQLRRLDQIALQARGVRVFLDPVVRQRIHLADREFEAIKNLLAECDRQCEQIGMRARQREIAPQAARSRVCELREQAHRRAISMLDIAQRLALKELLGPKAPFDAEQLVFRIKIER